MYGCLKLPRQVGFLFLNQMLLCENQNLKISDAEKLLSQIQV